MKIRFHLAKANILKNRSHTISLFLIILVVSMLQTIGLSVLLNVDADYMKNIDRLNSLHSILIMTQDMYQDSFEDLVKNDGRVSEYSIETVIYPERVTVDYGGVIDVNALICNLDTAGTISVPKIVEEDPTIPWDKAIYLPFYANSLGYELGDTYIMQYKNRPLTFTVAGFFETNEMAVSNGYGIKYYVHKETFEDLTLQMGRSVCIAIRFYDPYDSMAFNTDFRDSIDVELSSMGAGSLAADFEANSSITMSIMVFAALVVAFAFMITIILLMVIRFRVTNSIEDNMHSIGVMGAAGFTGSQIIGSFLLEYGMVALPAALLGIFTAMPMFPAIRSVMTSMSGMTWTLGANLGIGLLSALLIMVLLLLMVRLSCRRIKKLPPVVALRGGISTYSFRHNFFPLHKGPGNVQTRLGLKNMFAYGRLYAMIGVIVAAISLTITFLTVTYQNFVMDNTSILQMIGIEVADIKLTVSGHTDADTLAAEIEEMPDVRKTSMMDWVSVKVEGVDVAGFVSNDFSQMETMSTYEGRFPIWDNEIAMPETIARRFEKTIGDSVSVKANGITQEFIITGFYSTTNNGGYVCALTLEGFQRMNANQKRGTINVYLNDGVTVEDFSLKLQDSFGVVNMYKVDENAPYAAAKARAEEKISNYIDQYDNDSVEYAVIYNGDIIMSGSSTAYQIEKIENDKELVNAQTGMFASGISITTQFIAVISLVIIALI
ncbi:MAG: ABC transporter permease, partial [Oscillospiraceae bacterium]|nr:ABC transporter permease [Oscillospiraceae bacterium]